jgi:hypothetical protein
LSPDAVVVSVVSAAASPVARVAQSIGGPGVGPVTVSVPLRQAMNAMGARKASSRKERIRMSEEFAGRSF